MTSIFSTTNARKAAESSLLPVSNEELRKLLLMACNEIDRLKLELDRLVPPSPPDDVQAVFDAYLETWPKETRYSLTPKRRAKIITRLKEFDLATLCRAVHLSKFDPWEGRSQANACDLECLLRSQEQVEKWLGMKAPVVPSALPSSCDLQQRLMDQASKDEERFRDAQARRSMRG